MAAISAARSVLRSTTLRGAVSKAAAGIKSAARPSSRLLRDRHPLAARFALRSPVELSCAVESFMPMHTATASALMTSLLCSSHCGCGWVSEGRDETR